MIFENGLKKFDFARQNLDGRAKCLAKKRKKTLVDAIIAHYELTCELFQRISVRSTTAY